MAASTVTGRGLGDVERTTCKETNVLIQNITNNQIFLTKSDNDPNSTNDVINGFITGCTWLNTDTNNYFTCIDNSKDNAVWQQIGSDGNNLTLPLSVNQGGTGINTLTGLVKGNGTSAFTTITAPNGIIVGTTDNQILTNKTIDKDDNTLIGIANSGSNSDITELTGLTTPLSIAQGGTGVTNLDDFAATGSNNDITGLTGLTTPLSVTQGGTGTNILTGLVKGNGTSAFSVISAPTGNIIGTTDTQTLTNKTIDKSNNTLTGVAGSGINNDITSLTGLTTPLSIAQGGTGTTNLNDFADSGNNSDITSLTGLATPLSVPQGGTGINTLTGLIKGNGTSAFSTISAPTGNIIGTTDTQTLTNKTIDKSNNTLTGVASSGINNDITDLTGLTTPISVAQGGTGTNILTGLIKGNGTSAFSTISAPTSTITGISDTQTLTNKTIDKSNNTLTGVAGSGNNNDITTLTGLTTPLSVNQGGIGTNSLTGLIKGNGTSAFSTVSSPTGTIVGNSDTQTLTNKTIDKNNNTLTGVAGSGTNSDITSLTGLTAPLSESQGGTGTTSLNDFKALYTSIADITVSNTTTETTLLSSPISLSANYLTPGKTLQLKLIGKISSDILAGTLNIKVKIGSTVISQSTALTLITSLTNRFITLDFLITCRSTGISGSVLGCGNISLGTLAIGTPILMELLADEVTVNTTISNNLNVTATWGTANSNNSLTTKLLFVKALN